jgi:hypothetical protein
MREKIDRLCVENLRDSLWNVDSAGDCGNRSVWVSVRLSAARPHRRIYKARADDYRRGRAQLIFAGQVNHVVREVELHIGRISIDKAL